MDCFVFLEEASKWKQHFKGNSGEKPEVATPSFLFLVYLLIQSLLYTLKYKDSTTPKPLILSLQHRHLLHEKFRNLLFAHAPALRSCLQSSATQILSLCLPTADFLLSASGPTLSFSPSSPRVQQHHCSAWTNSRFIRLASAPLQIPASILACLISVHTWPAEKQRKHRNHSALPLISWHFKILP